MRRTATAGTRRASLFRARVSPLIALAFTVAFTTACPGPPVPKPWLFVAHSTGSIIQTFETTAALNGVPQFLQQPGTGLVVAAGPPLALRVVGKALYAAGNGSVTQYAIDPVTGTLGLLGTIPVGSPPYEMTSSATTLYVANRFSNDVSVLSIDPTTGVLASVQTAPVDAVNVIAIDPAGKFLFTGSRAVGTTAPKVCSHTLQADGSLPAGAGSCVTLSGVPQSMVHTNGVLFLLVNKQAPGVMTNVISAFTVDATSGVLTPRGADLDIGAANAGSFGASTDGQFLFLPRQGSFMILTTGVPMQTSGVTPITNSPACVWPPASAGGALADPRGGTLYVSDPVGSALASPQGARVSSFTIGAGGTLTPIICATVGGKPIAMAAFVP